MNFFSPLFRWKILNSSLRVKITLVFIIPVILTMSLLSYFHIQNERAELQDLAEEGAVQMARMALASLNHAMMMNDREMEQSLLQDIAAYPLIQNARLISMNMKVRSSTDLSEVQKKYDLTESGCVECHQYAPSERPHSMPLSLTENVLRVAVIVENEPQCRQCHLEDPNHLGILLVDASLDQTEKRLRDHTLSSIQISLISIGIVMGLSFLLVQWLVVRRVEVIRTALLRLGGQDFSTRITKYWNTHDELTELGDQFNRIASDLELLQTQKKEKERVRTLSIIEERERIARELHDGVAQFLAYLSAKVGAIRVELKNQKIESAEKNLAQIDKSIHEQSMEVRSSILGLKMAGNVEKGLLQNVTQFVEQCNRLDDLAVELRIEGNVSLVKLDSEKELQIMRILQEAVSNIRKHAKASEAYVRLEADEKQFKIIVADNGVGFDLLQTGMVRVGHFGLQIIFERAQEIGAHIEVKSAPGEGTTIIVIINLLENQNADFGRG